MMSSSSFGPFVELAFVARRSARERALSLMFLPREKSQIVLPVHQPSFGCRSLYRRSAPNCKVLYHWHQRLEERPERCFFAL